MTSLRDIRLWLIVALALLCLIAIRNCTIDYQNTSEESTAAVSDDATDSETTVAQSENDTEDTAQDSAKLAENAESDAGESTETNQLLSEASQSSTASSESAETTNGESDTDAATAADATGNEDEVDTDGSVQANADTESDTSSSTAAKGGNTGESQVQIIKSELVEFKLGELSDTGEFGVDLTNDISTLREGLSDYGGRIGSLKQTIEKVRSEM